MSRILPATARRIDRLSRRAHAFHRFAHHPLCDAYAGEVIRIGRRTRICKGCTFALVGAATGLVAGLVAPLVAPFFAVAGLALAVACAVMPVRGFAAEKVERRFVPTLLLVFVAVESARRFDLLGGVLLAAAIALSAASLLAHRRRGPWREPCVTCTERLDGDVVCSGFRRQAARERAFARLSARWLAEVGPLTSHDSTAEQGDRNGMMSAHVSEHDVTQP